MGLRSKLAIAFLGLLMAVVFAIGAIQINRTMKLMIGDLAASGDLLTGQAYEQMRVTLSSAHGDPLTALAHDASLRALLDSYRAFGKGVAYARIESPDGSVIIATPESPGAPAVPPVQSFENLQAETSSWLRMTRVFLLWGDSTYEMRREIRINGKPFAVLDVGLSTALTASELKRSIREVLIVAAVAVAAAIAAAMFLGGMLLRPVAAMATGVDELAAGLETQKVRIGGRDELSSLAEKFNRLSQRLNRDRSRWEQDRGQFFSIFRSISDAVLLLDSVGAILFANSEAIGRLGLPAGGVTDGKAIKLLLGKSHPLTRMIEAVYATATEVHDVAIQIDDGTTNSLLVSIFSLGNGHAPAGLLVIVRDLEPVQELENVVDQSARLARLGALVTGIAHQVRTPLNAMNLQLELATQDTDRGLPITSRLQAVRREMHRVDDAVCALTRFIRPETLQLEAIELNEMIQEVAARVLRPGIKVEYDFDARARSVTADRALLSEAIRNVAINAVEAMPDGGLIAFRTHLTVEGFLEIKIADRGNGIPSEQLERIFQLYFTTKNSGTGIGLPLATRAIDLHRGTLEVSSEVGTGTTITIRLPIEDQTDAMPAPAVAAD